MLAKIKDKLGDYNGAIRLLLKHNCIADALQYVAKYEANNIPISKCYQVHILASEHAEKLLKLTNIGDQEWFQKFEAVLQYVSPTERVRYYKAAGMYENACEILKSERKYKELYRIYRAHGWHEEGIQLSKSQRDKRDELTFFLFKATKEMESDSGKLMDATIEMLTRKLGSRTDDEVLTSLIYGMAIQNDKLIGSACRYYKMAHNFIGHIEALNIAVARIEYDEVRQKWKNIHLTEKENLIKLVLHACKEIKSTVDDVNAFLDADKEPNLVQQQLLKQIESFYGLERKTIDEEAREVYCVPPSSYPWTNQLLLEEGLVDECDDDGMLQLEVQSLLKAFCNRLNHFTKRWIVNDELKLVERFSKELGEYPLHQQIISGGFLTQSERVINFQQYLTMLCTAFDMAYYGSTDVGSASSIMESVLNAFSPQATCYMPTSSFTIHSNPLTEKLHQKVADVISKNDRDFDFNKWLEAWRINCVTRKGSMIMKDTLSRRSEYINRQRFIPPVYAEDRTRQYRHLMLLWLKTCEMMRNDEVLPSCTVAVHDVIRHIASHESIWNTISVSNLLNIVMIHTTAILTMYASYLVCLNNEGHVYMPSSYKQVVKVFHSMNSTASGAQKTDFYKSCIGNIVRKNDLSQIPSKLQNLLKIILKVMIGNYNENFNPLRYALSNEHCLKNHEAHHCLIFVFVLFGNIGLMNCSNNLLFHYRSQIYNSVKHCTDPVLKEAYHQFSTSVTIAGCFGAARRLLEASEDNLVSMKLCYNPTLRDIEITFGPNLTKMYQFNQRLFPVPIQPSTQLVKPVEMRAPSTLSATAIPFIPYSVQGPVVFPAIPANLDMTPELNTMDSIEPEENDPETIEALKRTESEHHLIIQPEIEDDPMVKEDFCNICACPLRPQRAHESVDPSSVPDRTESTMETRSNHCRSEKHLTKIELYNRFDSEEKDYYKPLKESLHEILPQCKALFKVVFDDELQKIIDAIENELKKGDDELTKIRYSGEWREGVTLLENDLCDRLRSLEMKAKRLMEEKEKKKVEIEKSKEQEDEKEAEEVKEDEQMEDIFEDEVVSKAKPNVGEKIRRKNRDMKKRRKGKG